MTAILALGFVIGAVVDYLALGVTLNMVGGSVSDRCNAKAIWMPPVPAKKKVLSPFAVVALKGGQCQRPSRH